MRKKLLQVNSSIGYGSTGRIIEDICCLASKDGWDCTIAHGARYVSDSRFSSFKVSSRVGEYLHFAESYLLDRHGLGSSFSTRQFVRMIDTVVKPDVIHLHNIHGYYINYEILFDYLHKVGIPVMWTLHDCWTFTGHCSHFENVGCRKWKTGCHDCPNRGEYPRSLGIDASRDNYSRKKSAFNSVGNLQLITVSEWLRNMISDSYMKGHQVRTIANGVDTCLFNVKDDRQRSCYKESWGLEGKKVILGVANVWNRQKGLFDFISLSDRMPEDTVIVMAGLDVGMSKVLPSNILPVGRLSDPLKLSQLYSIADVFVNPTYGDTFPTTNLEAMACGTPVVTYRTGGSPECITVDTGYVVDVSDMEALVAAISKVTEGNRDDYRTNCRRHAVDRYEKNDRYREYVELYDLLTG